LVGESPDYNVERRYSDFVLFHKELARAFPGAILPPLPKDQVFGRFQQSFIEARMRALDDFICRIHDHPDIRDSPIIRCFLSVAVFDEDSVAAAEAVAAMDNPEVKATPKKSSWLDLIDKLNPTLSESKVYSVS
jgi:hypothetical protein